MTDTLMELPEGFKGALEAAHKAWAEEYFQPGKNAQLCIEDAILAFLNAALDDGEATEGGPDLPGVQNAAFRCIILKLEQP